MARPLVFRYQDAESSFDFAKVDRSKLYGRRVRMHLDPDGQPCAKARVTDDGWMLIRSGMSAQGYFAEDGAYLKSSQLVGLDDEGNALDKHSSTLGAAQDLEGPVSPEALLDLRVHTIYQLDPTDLDPALYEALQAGKLFRFPFSYRGGYALDVGILLENEHGAFALVGKPVDSEWCSLDMPPSAPAFDDDDDDDDLDFEMF